MFRVHDQVTYASKTPSNTTGQVTAVHEDCVEVFWNNGVGAGEVTACMPQTLKNLTLRVVRTEYECVEGDYAYRIAVDDSGRCLVARTNAQRPNWHHGVLREMYEVSSDSFKPACVAKSPYDVDSLDQALAVVARHRADYIPTVEY